MIVAIYCTFILVCHIVELRMFSTVPMRFLGGAVGQSAYRPQIFAKTPLFECWKGRSNCSGHSCLFGSVAVPAFDEAGFRNMKLLPYKYVYDVHIVWR